MQFVISGDGRNGGIMRFETVNFNIFEENLQEIVYGEKSACEKERKYKAEKQGGITIQKTAEIVIKPLNKEGYERNTGKF